MNEIRIRFRPLKPAEPPPLAIPLEPIVQDEITGLWSVWHEHVGFPSRAFAADVWLQRQRRDVTVRQ
jgi:hypothetical protein